MSSKKVPSSLQHSTAGPYSPVLKVTGRELVVISGQGPLDQDGGLVGTSIEEQTRVTMDHCERLLDAAGAGFQDVFRVNVYLSDLANWDRFNQVYREYLPEPLPVRTAVGVNLLLGMLVEVDMWAIL